jgi:uncharacterized damage-inducible protein DinB
MDATTAPRGLARYNRWMNERVYAIGAALREVDRRRDLRAFFRSVHGTLNHVLLVDRLWLGRLVAPDAAVSRRPDGTPIAVTTLDHELYADFAEMQSERARTDAVIMRFADGLTPARMTETLTFRAVGDGQMRSMPIWVAVTQLFNHQTHHRGQLTTLLSQLGIDPGVTDFPWTPDLQDC